MKLSWKSKKKKVIAAFFLNCFKKGMEIDDIIALIKKKYNADIGERKT